MEENLLKIREIIDSIVIHGILAYITLCSFVVTIELVNKMFRVSWIVAIMFYFFIFTAISHITNKRITPYNQYDFKHPTKIIGFVTAILILILFYNLGKNGVIKIMN
jgi:hypothetical protein